MVAFFKQFLIFIFLLESFIFSQPSEFAALFKTQLTYQEKLGQLLVLNITPSTPKETIVKAIKDYKIGNFNITGLYAKESDLKTNINLINDLSAKYLKAKPFIGADEEGEIRRISWFNFKKQKDLKDINESYYEAYQKGRALKNLGINMIFAPVLDFTENSKDYIWPRTFQKDKETTIQLAEAMIDGFSDSFIISVIKHFPGYLDSDLNPHGKIYESKPLKDYSSSIEVFEKVLKDKGVLGIMVGHLVIEEFGQKPITRLAEFVSDFRKKYSYQGLLVTDSIGMASYRLNDTFKESALETLLARYNLIILSSNTEVSFEIVDYLLKQLDKEEVQKAIDDSFLKVYLIKQFLLKN